MAIDPSQLSKISGGISKSNEAMGSIGTPGASTTTGGSSAITLPALKSDKKISDASSKLGAIEDPFSKTTNQKDEKKQEAPKDENGETLAPGTKLGNGQKVNEKGEVEDNTTKKVLGGLTTAAGAYFGGTKGAEVARSAQKTGLGNKLIGTISDASENTKVGQALSKAADEQGLGEAADGVNNVVDMMSDAKNGNFSDMLKKAKELKKNTKKIKDKQKKQLLIKVGIPALGILLGLFGIVIILFPIMGGGMDLIENIVQVFDDDNEGGGEDDEEVQTEVKEILSQIPNFDSLSEARKNILTAAALGLVNEISYKTGGHPTGAGISGTTGGLDCAGFVQWCLLTGTGYSKRLTTGEITNLVGKDFIEVSADELQPGDIGLYKWGGSDYEKKTYNHAGIYVGNGQYIHDSSTAGQVTKSKGKFTKYVRYVGAD